MVKECAKARDVAVRHVLVLICRDKVGAGEWESFQRLVAASGEDKLFDLAYVMLHELEPGHKPDAEVALLLNSQHVWTLAVGDLLLNMLHDAAPTTQATTASFAWRSYQLVPEISAAEEQGLFVEQLERFYHRRHRRQKRSAGMGNEVVYVVSAPQPEGEQVSTQPARRGTGHSRESLAAICSLAASRGYDGRQTVGGTPGTGRRCRGK